MLYSKQDLADFCLRSLGAPIINIEVDDAQLSDKIELAIQFYQENHFDGVERDFVLTKIVPTEIQLLDATGFVVGDTVTAGTKSAKVVSVSGNSIFTDKASGGVFVTTDLLTNGTVSSEATMVNLGQLDLGYFELPDQVFSVLRVIPTTSVMNSSELLFDFQYQLMYNEMQRITSSGGIQYFVGTMNYMAHLDFILKKEKTFRFNRRMNKVFVDSEWGKAKLGDTFAFEVYMALDPETYTEVYNDMWLKKYATALIKQQWGQNLKKYSGMSLPGGITYNGQQIYNEATEEIDKLEQQALDSGAPLGLYVG